MNAGVVELHISNELEEPDRRRSNEQRTTDKGQRNHRSRDPSETPTARQGGLLRMTGVEKWKKVWNTSSSLCSKGLTVIGSLPSGGCLCRRRCAGRSATRGGGAGRTSFRAGASTST